MWYCFGVACFALKHFSFVLLATNSLSFVHLWESLFQLDFVNDRFAGYRILARQLFCVCWTLNILSPCLWPQVFLLRSQLFIFLGFSPLNNILFSLSAFRFSPYFLLSATFKMMELCRSILILLRNLFLSFFQKFGKFLIIISLKFFSLSSPYILTHMLSLYSSLEPFSFSSFFPPLYFSVHNLIQFNFKFANYFFYQFKYTVESLY